MRKNLKYVFIVIIVFAILYVLYKNNSENLPSNLSSSNISSSVKENNKIVIYHAKWCGHCKKFKQELAQGLESKLKNYVDIEYVDCDDDSKKCATAGVTSYPTIILYTNTGKYLYSGDRSEKHLIKFISSIENKKQEPTKQLVIHHTKWCGYCTRFKQELEQGLEGRLKKHANIEYVDCEDDPEKCVSAGVKGYPTIILYTDNGKHLYKGDRSEEDLTNFILQH
jgi:thioredoxin-related protein